jgi:murein DD-endopeptidase MepM/ murein hydrolase activator NlpD
MPLRRRWSLFLVAGLGVCACLGVVVWRQARANQDLFRWFTRPQARGDLVTSAHSQPCPGAPFILPTAGFVGLLWGDTRLPYSPIRKHSGLDIFGDGDVGTVPVYAAFDGFLTRLPTWKSAVIIRHLDPLNPSRHLWTYYAHMADEMGNSFIAKVFPPGSVNVPVEQGILLGYQGVFNGGNGRIGLHLHFSIVQEDGNGRFLNETDIGNTLDPSPYLGMRLNYACADRVPVCSSTVDCQ